MFTVLAMLFRLLRPYCLHLLISHHHDEHDDQYHHNTVMSA
jgi:hypothetical protein